MPSIGNLGSDFPNLAVSTQVRARAPPRARRRRRAAAARS
jgi:hypothetical protein